MQHPPRRWPVDATSSRNTAGIESPARVQAGVAALAIGLAAGGVFYQIETRRAEQLALENAVEGARHVEAPAMLMAITQNPEEHRSLSRRCFRCADFGTALQKADGVC